MDFIDGQEPDETNLKHMAPMFGDMLPGQEQREANMKRMKAMRAEPKFKVRPPSVPARCVSCLATKSLVCRTTTLCLVDCRINVALPSRRCLGT